MLRYVPSVIKQFVTTPKPSVTKSRGLNLNLFQNASRPWLPPWSDPRGQFDLALFTLFA